MCTMSAKLVLNSITGCISTHCKILAYLLEKHYEKILVLGDCRASRL